MALLTAQALLRGAIGRGEQVLDLKGRLRCRECGKRGRAVVGIKWRREGA